MAAKGYDDSPPRNGVIFFYSVLTVVFLFGVQQMLNSYFSKMMNDEFEVKVFTVGLDAAKEAKARDHEQLEKNGIDGAMKLYAQRGRSASVAIAPQSGANKPGIGGWSQLKRELPAAPAAPAAVPAPSAVPEVPAQGAAPAPAAPAPAAPAAPAGAKP